MVENDQIFVCCEKYASLSKDRAGVNFSLSSISEQASSWEVRRRAPMRALRSSRKALLKEKDSPIIRVSSTFKDDIRSDSEDGDTLPHQDESSSDFSVEEGPQPFSESEINYLVRDLALSKDGAELLGSRLKNKNLLTCGYSFSWYRHREKEFTQFLSKEGNLIFCDDVQGLKKCFDIEYDPSKWRLFIDSSKTSLKAVLLHNGNSFAPLSLGHSVHLEENYNDLSVDRK
ncbi:hypothetical protein AVEN_30745-1 [Araneus ventricosus]|uniref:Uncharacterized protein n=1 Tax=Araneus ventricosus TaxID=182803 RepID=A0A4Y2C6L4_ARAVE|nr:hypothetical protein AVEN_30745-1 [Araneus ventricosus]